MIADAEQTPIRLESSPATPTEDEMAAAAAEAAVFLKALAHEGRLLILCHLAGGELSVSEIEARLGIRQAAVSQQLARLRLEGLVTSRREGKTMVYSLGDPRAATLVQTLHRLFCPPNDSVGERAPVRSDQT